MAQYISVDKPQNVYPQNVTERYNVDGTAVGTPQEWSAPGPPASSTAGEFTIRDGGLLGRPEFPVPPVFGLLR